MLATVMGAIDLGYRVTIVADAICSGADSTHDAMIEIYESRFGMQVETVHYRRSGGGADGRNVMNIGSTPQRPAEGHAGAQRLKPGVVSRTTL